MKTFTKLFNLVLVVSVLLFAQKADAQNKVINVNVYGTALYNNSAWNNWNTVSGSLTSAAFKYSDGSNSAINAVLSAQSGYSDNGASYPVTMCPQQVGRDASWHTSPRTLTFNGLDNSKRYDLSLYASRVTAGQTTRFTINGVSRDIATASNYANAANFTDLAPTAGSIIVTLTQLEYYNYINGFTITEKTVVNTNQNPVANAGSNQTIQLPVSSVTLNGSGTDTDGTIASYAWSQVSGTSATIASPSAATTNITGLTTAGVRVFRLTVTDNQGATGTSDVTITVNAANQSPVANGGGNKTIQLPVSTVSLSGSGTDTDGTIASYAWSQVSGTAATIASPSAATTNITGLTTAGVRVFRLTVTDNQGATGTNDVTVTVTAANVSPTANAGANQAIQLPVSTVTLNGSGTDTDGTIASYAWSQVSGTAATIASPSAATTNITGLTTAGVRVFRLTVTDNNGATATSDVTITVTAANAAPTANAGANQSIQLPTASVTLNGSGVDTDGSITSYAWSQLSGTTATIVSPSSATTDITGLTTAGVRVFRLTVTDNNGATGTSDVTITVNPVGNQLPTANAGPNQSIQLPASTVTLNGSGTDTDGTIASYAWSQVSGTIATIASPSSATTNITGLTTAGVRIFRLTVTDNNGATGTSDVTITVTAANIAPTANAGANQSIQLPTSTVTLSGSGADSDGTIASYAWSQVSGTTATIASPSAATTNITGLTTAGVRVFRLTVTDNQGATGTSDVTVTVNAAANQSPVANGGGNKAIQLPTSTVTLNGSGTDTDGTIASYAWSQVSGTAATIASPSAATTNITGLTTAGVRVFRLTVTDNQGATGTNDVTVTVTAANQAPVANAGANQSITLPTSAVTLNGSGADVDGTIASYAWSQVSGTAATIASPSSATTSITGLTTAGTRVFRLTVTDNQGATGTSDITITVNAQSTGANKVVNVNVYGTALYSNSAWNNWNTVSGPLTSAAFNYSDGSSSSINAVLSAQSGYSDNGASYPVTMCPQQVGRDASWHTSPRTLTLNGLDNTKRYDLSLYASRVTAGQTTRFTINGVNRDIATASNYTNAANFTDIAPTAGSIVVTLTQLEFYNYINGFTLTEKAGTTSNQAPAANAGSNQTIQLPLSTVTLNGSGTDTDGTIASYAWSQVSGTAATIASPSAATTNITGLTTAGVRVFRLTVTDNNGATGTSDVIITVTAANQNPVANAGSNQAIQLPVSTVTLNGSGTDADGTIASYAWSQVSGTAATIASPSAATTNITGLTTAGIRVFRLTVTDNNGATGTSDVTITVNAAANQSPVANAGSGQSIQLPVSTVTLNGSGTDTDGTIASYAWSQVSGTAATIASPSAATTNITGLTTAGVRVFRLTVTDNNGATGTSDVTITVTAANVAPTANAGSNQTIQLPASTVTLNGSGIDTDGTIASYAWTQVSGTAATIASPSTAITNITGLTTSGIRIFRLTVTDNNGATGTSDVTITVDEPGNQSPVANAGVNQSIQLPVSTVSLSGSGNDADGTIASYAWTQVSGTTATIESPSSAATDITGLTTVGSRVFRLTVTDDLGAIGISDVTIVVNAANVAPTANAGTNQTIQLPVSTVSLSGSGTDTDGTIASYAWTQVSGTAATIASPSAATTNITGLTTAGVRVFRLTVTDNQGATGTSDVTITVNPANVAPVANGGGDKVITLPVSTVTLTGSGSDTDGTVASYAWSQASGTAATIASPSAATTNITGLTTAGTRVFRLTVTDNQGATGTSDVTVVVNQAPVANAGSTQVITLPTSTATLNGSGTDTDGTIAGYAWTQVSGTAATIASPSAATTNITGLTTSGTRVFRLTVTDNQGATATSDVTIIVNQPPVANGGGDKSVTLPASSVSLAGSGTDADGTIASYAWTQVSGTAATIASPSAATTNITGLTTVGVRVFRLTVTDNRGATGTNDVTVTVNPGNQVPVANAGSAQNINLPISSVTLTGSGTDSDGTIAGYAWTQVSGTAATIASPSSATTNITGLTTAGARVFRLTVTDNQGATGTSDVTITVNPASVLDPADPIITYNSNTPPTEPAYGTIGKWVRTKRLNTWNTDSYKAYYYKGRQFRLKFPKTYNPAVNDGKKYPILLFFHGRGEGSTSTYDNEYQLYHGGQIFKDAVDNGTFDGYVLAMQTTSSWGVGEYAYLKEIIDYMIVNNKLDPFKIIANGLSAGGQGTWEMLLNNPTYVASALPMSAVYSSFTSSTIVNQLKFSQIWNFHGGLDNAPSPYTAYQVRDAMAAAGAQYKNTEYPSLGHGTWYEVWAEPEFWPYVNKTYMSNPWPLFGRTEFCTGDPINVTIGLMGGFNGYRWRKDGQIINGATSNTITATSTGVYDAQVLRGGIWSDWSRIPVEIKIKAPTVSPSITIDGLMSNVIPALDGNTNVTLKVPEGYTSYIWQKEGSAVTIGTANTLSVGIPGNYAVKVTELYGCSSSFSAPFTVIDANGPNKPDAASNLIATAVSKTSIKLDWSDNPAPLYNETGFEIYQSLIEGGGYKLITVKNADVLTHTITGLKPNTKYFFKVRAINATAGSAASNTASAVTEADIQAPTTPGNLVVTGTTRSSVALSWNSSTDDVAVIKYMVYVNGVEMYPVDTVSGTVSFTVNSLDYGKTYNFAIRAKDATGNLSPFSNQVSAQSLNNGLAYKHYTFEGDWPNLPDFSTLVPVATGMMPNVALTPRVQDDNFAFLWEGYINIPTSGTYYFRTNSDDGSKLYLGSLNGTGSPYNFSGTATVNNDGQHGSQNATSSALSLSAGTYPIAIAFFEQGGGEGMSISWRTPSSGTSYVTIPNSVFIDNPLNNGSAPAAPSNIAASATAYNKIALSWTDNSNNESGFEVWRSTQAATGFSPVGLAPANATTFVDSLQLSPATTYYYQMRAIGQFGESAFAPTNDAQANWKFNNNYNDATGNGKTLTANSSPTFSTDRQEGSHAVDLNGSNQDLTVNTSSGDYIRGGYTAKTVAFWMKADVTTSGTTRLGIFDFGGSDDGLGMFLQSNVLTAGVASNNTRRSITVGYTSTAWNHIALVYSTNTLRLYVNGTQVASNTSLGFTSVGTTSDASAIGDDNNVTCFSTSTGYFGNFNGKFDDFAIYDEALSATDIAKMINGTYGLSMATTSALPGIPAVPSNLIASGVSTSAINVTWNDNANNETGYELFRSGINNSNYILYKQLPAGTTSYKDSALFANAVFYYKVRAVGAGGASAYTAEDSAKTLNTKPVIAQLPARSARYDAVTTIEVSATDADGDQLTFTILNNPAFGAFTNGGNNSATLVLSPSIANNNTVYNNVTIVAADPNGGTDTTRFDLTVNSNYDPVIATIADYTIDEGQTQNINLSASDLNNSDVLTWSVENLPSQFTLTPGANGNAVLMVKPNYAAAGSYNVKVSVSDGNGGMGIKSFTLNVTDKEISNSRVYIRFQLNNVVGAPWNNITSANTANLKDDQNNNSGMGLQFQTPWFSTYNDGPQTGNNSGIYPDAVLKEYYFFGQYPGTFTGPDQSTAKLTGLDITRKYNISFYAGSSWPVQVDNGTTTFTIGAETLSLAVQNNTQNVVTFSNITPAADGTITFTAGRAPGTLVGYLGAIVVNSVFDDGTPPVAPTSLVGQDAPGSGAQLNWVDIAYNETGYEIYRSATAGGTYALVGQIAANTTSYLDTTANGNTSYYYKVRAVNTYGNSGYSNIANVVTTNKIPKINPIANVTVKNNQATVVNVTATDDPGDQLTFSATGLPIFATLINNGNGSASINVNPLTGSIGEFPITVSVKDSYDSVRSASFVLSVTDKDVKSVYINFTDGGANVAGAPWNNFTNPPFTGASITNLKDDAGATTTMAATLVNGFEWYVITGMNSNEGTNIYPDAVVRSAFYESSTTTRTIRVSGLTPTKRYNFVFFASREDGYKSVTNYTINGTTVSLDPSYNVNKTVQINGITPNASGQVDIAVAKAASQNYAFISSLVVQEYDNSASLILSPQDLTVTDQKRNSISLRWADRSSNETGFQVWRSTGGSYSLIATTAANATTYTNTGLTANTTYYYIVRAVNASLQSSYTLPVKTSTLVNAVYMNYANTNAAPLPWNNAGTNPQQDYVWSNLNDEVGIPTNLNMKVTKNFAGLYSAGVQTGNNSGIFPDKVMFDSYGLYPGETGKLKVSGLNLSLRYDISFFGSTTALGDVNTAYMVNGKRVMLNTSVNSTGIVTIYGVQPDQNGEIEMIVAPGTPTSQFGLLGAAIIKGYTTPVGSVQAPFPPGAVQAQLNQAARSAVIVNEVAATPVTPAVAAVPEKKSSVLSEVNAYPNPFRSDVTVSVTSGKQQGVVLQIFDMNGKLLHTVKRNVIAGKNNIVLAGTLIAKAGIYIVKVTGEADVNTNVKTIRIIKQ